MWNWQAWQQRSSAATLKVRDLSCRSWSSPAIRVRSVEVHYADMRSGTCCRLPHARAAVCTEKAAPASGADRVVSQVVSRAGNAAYYLPFMDALYDGLGGRASVIGVSNLGQCGNGLAGKVSCRLQNSLSYLLSR